MYISYWNSNPKHATILREAVVRDTEQQLPAEDDDGIVHVCARRCRRGWEYEDDDREHHTEKGDDRDRQSLTQKTEMISPRGEVDVCVINDSPNICEGKAQISTRCRRRRKTGVRSGYCTGL